MQALSDTVDCIVCSERGKDAFSNDYLQGHPQSTSAKTPRCYDEQLRVEREMQRRMRTKTSNNSKIKKGRIY